MILQRYDPFRDFARVEDVFDRMWGGRPRWGYSSRRFTNHGEGSWAIPLDVVRGDDAISVHASLPGIKPEHVSVTIEDDVLTVSGQTESEEEHKEDAYLMRERRFGSFRRSLRLPETVDPDRAETTYEDGVLTVTLPKSEAKRAKQLTVKAKGAEAAGELIPAP